MANTLTINKASDVSGRNGKDGQKLNTGSMRKSYGMKNKKMSSSLNFRVVSNKYIAGK
tara:strand:- start:228 stop:401 length:174 start_codon:yes stop_codon:yes gene_type:complete